MLIIRYRGSRGRRDRCGRLGWSDWRERYGWFYRLFMFMDSELIEDGTEDTHGRSFLSGG
jgi:hypothetical protein